MFSALWLGPTLASMSLLFTPYSPQPIKKHFSSAEKFFFPPIGGKIYFFLQKMATLSLFILGTGSSKNYKF
jgi:hypothetical protein